MFIVVNLKTYDVDPTAIAHAAKRVSEETGARIAVAPQSAHLERVVETGVETWAQHVDPIEPGSNTGGILAETVADIGCQGTILNHSERRLRLADIDTSIEASNRSGLETIVCANNPVQIGAVTALEPDAVAVEPPELIGTGTPVSQADPEVVTDAVAAAADIDESVDVLCGAGISTGADVAAARELGSAGVLLASGVAKASDPQAALEGLVDFA